MNNETWAIFEGYPLNNLTRGIGGYLCRFGISFTDEYGHPGIRQVEGRGNTAEEAIIDAHKRAELAKEKS